MIFFGFKSGFATATEISAFAAEPSRLTAMADAARSVGRLDAAERLADLVAKVAAL